MNLSTQIWLHVNSGNKYRITGFTIREADFALLVTYTLWDDSSSVVWSRPASEFFDARMQIVP